MGGVGGGRSVRMGPCNTPPPHTLALVGTLCVCGKSQALQHPLAVMATPTSAPPFPRLACLQVLSAIDSLESPKAKQLGAMILAASQRLDQLWVQCTPTMLLGWMGKMQVGLAGGLGVAMQCCMLSTCRVGAGCRLLQCLQLGGHSCDCSVLVLGCVQLPVCRGTTPKSAHAKHHCCCCCCCCCPNLARRHTMRRA